MSGSIDDATPNEWDEVAGKRPVVAYHYNGYSICVYLSSAGDYYKVTGFDEVFHNETAAKNFIDRRLNND